MTNTADPGYAAAAARRGASPKRRRLGQPAVVLGCLLVGFTMAVAYVHTHRSAPEAAKVHNSLVVRVKAAQATGDALEAKAQQLDGEIAKVRQRALPRTSLGALQRAQP